MPVEGDVDYASPAGAVKVASRLAHATALMRDGSTGEAEVICREIVRRHPTHAEALHLLGLTILARGDRTTAIGLLRAAVRANPENASFHGNLGHALSEAGDWNTALSHYRRALAIAPTLAALHYSSGNAWLALGNFPASIASFDRAIELQPRFAQAHNNRGNACLAGGEVLEALQSYRRAVDSDPEFPFALANCAKVLSDLGRWPEALPFYDRWVGLRPTDAEAWRRRAHCMILLGRSHDAFGDYDRAVALSPDDAESLAGRGLAARRLKRHAQAVEDFTRASSLEPASVDILYRKAEALRDSQRPAEAAEVFARVLELEPDREFALGNLIHARLQSCDWTDYHALVGRALRAISEGRRVYMPGQLLAVADSAQSQWHCARLLGTQAAREDASRDDVVGHDMAATPTTPAPHEKIRIAYVSTDFREHPVAVLLVGVLEHHDRERFEIIGIALAAEQETTFGQRVKNAFDRFLDVSRNTDAEVAALLRELDVDIAVDLMGLTGGARGGIFAYHAARVQVNYLGYTGTTASPGLDYVLADSIVVPPAEQDFFSENVVHLPGSYQPSDDKRRIAEETPTRVECALPEQGFVFCCFNTHYKISPDIFAVWMRLLSTVPRSVLWLSAGSDLLETNLRNSARDLGVAAERLIFAPRIADAARHLARHGCADLFLDTMPFNAHATASDALWAGLPVLTCRGGSFAGRVATSLLSAIGLAELATSNLQEYEIRARGLACNPEALAELRRRLKRNRATHPLFATARHTANLESAFRTMMDRHRRGETAAGFTVVADSP